VTNTKHEWKRTKQHSNAWFLTPGITYG